MKNRETGNVIVLVAVTIVMILFLIIYSIVLKKGSGSIDNGYTKGHIDIEDTLEVYNTTKGEEAATTQLQQTTEEISQTETEPSGTEVDDKTTEQLTSETTTEKKTTEKKTTEKKTTEKKTEPPTEETTTENPTKYIEADISAFVDEAGDTIITRFKVPDGFKRITYGENTFSSYIQNTKLKPHGTKMLCYDDDNNKIIEKENQSWCAAVADISIEGNRGWLQCADFVMKFIADYLYENERYGDISFDLMNGVTVPFSEYSKGKRLNSKATKLIVPDYDVYTGTGRDVYNVYMVNAIYCYANTTSLKNQCIKGNYNLKIDNVFPGAFFIMDVSESGERKYGHAIMVVDVAVNPTTGEVAYLLGQGGTPSEEFNIFLNPLHYDDPWFYSSETYKENGYTMFDIPFRPFKQKNLYYLPSILPY